MPIVPSQGSVNGGTNVIISGSNLENASNVFFNNKAATIIKNTSSSITVISPPGNGVSLVTVETSGGISNPLNFYYIPYPVIVSLSDVSGPLVGGNKITISGYNLSTASSITFGEKSVVPTINNDSQINVIVPAASTVGTVGVSLTTAGGSTSGFSYTYYDVPIIDSIFPISGSILGGTPVTITGTNLAIATNVTFNVMQAAFGVINDNNIVAIAPSNIEGIVDIIVTTNAGTATLTDAYQYTTQPTI